MTYKELVKQEIGVQLRSTGLSEACIRQLTPLYSRNVFAKAEAITRRLPEMKTGAVAYGLLTKETYANIDLKSGVDLQLQIDLNRTASLAGEFNKDFTTRINGEEVLIKSPARLNQEYARGQISREEWLKGLNTFKTSSEDYIFRSYE